MDNGGDHGGTPDRRSSPAQSGDSLHNSSRQTRHRVADAALSRSGRVSSLDGRLGAIRRRADVRETRTDVVQVVVDRRSRRLDADSAVQRAHRLYGRNRVLSLTISSLQNRGKSLSDSFPNSVIKCVINVINNGVYEFYFPRCIFNIICASSTNIMVVVIKDIL